jgi:organic radical activating enzyme
MKGYISEIFKSFQGEGIYCGVKQIFIRFAICNLMCKWCDTKYSSRKSKFCFIYIDGKKIKEKNPISTEKIIKFISLYKNNIHSVSLTGGEPLLQHEFLKNLTFLLKKKKMKIYLETAGINWKELNQVIYNIDYIAMDMKLPSSTGMRAFWDEHEKFLEIANRKNVFVKVVVTNTTKKEEIIKCARIINLINKSIPLVIQPVFHNFYSPNIQKLNEFKKICEKFLEKVYIVPQVHKILKIK